jgi:hypothetical protein
MEFHTLSQPSCSFKPEAGSARAHTHYGTITILAPFGIVTQIKALTITL